MPMVYHSEKCLLDCSDGEIRVVNGSTALQGRVEVCIDGNWGTVCDASWGAGEAMVACRQLGFSPTGMYLHYTLHGSTVAILTPILYML